MKNSRHAGVKINIVYFIYINEKSNWRKIVSEQLSQINDYGLIAESNLYIHICTPFTEDEVAIDFLQGLHSKAIISTSKENQFEFRPIKLIYDLANKEPESIFIYFHTKGISYNIQERSIHEISLLTHTFKNWRAVIDLFLSTDVSKVGLFPALAEEELIEKDGARGGWIWFNFWYARGKYLQLCDEPIISNDRYYYEAWLAMQGNKTIISNNTVSIFKHTDNQKSTYFHGDMALLHLNTLAHSINKKSNDSINYVQKYLTSAKLKGSVVFGKAQKKILQTKNKTKSLLELAGHHLFKRTPIRPIAQLHLKKINSAKIKNLWKSTGNDPQMLLEPSYPIRSMPSGWYMLEYFFKSKHPASHQLFIDLGEGFMPAINLTWVSESHHAGFPIYLPSNWKSLRFDPLNHEGSFQISDIFLRRLAKRPESLLTENLPAYQYLEHYQENHNVSGWLSPIQELTPINNNPLHLKSNGEDPYFIWEQPNPHGIPAGWYLWQLKINQLNKIPQSTTARLYLDTGTGFNEFETVNLPLSTKNESVSRIFFAPKDVFQIRFDPIDYPGDFKLEALNIDAVTEKDALGIMLSRLALTKKHEGKGNDEIILRIQQSGSFSSKSAIQLVLSSYEETQVSDDTLINYREWIDTIEKQLIPSPEKIKETIATFSALPVISVIIPTYNTPIKYLRLCIESIINQSYPHWELCIADDQSPNKDIRNVLEEYSQKDSRIKYTIREQNGHISAASNSALALATGDYIALMDHDDALPTYALFFVANAINENPDAEVIYSDEDKIDGDGLRSDPNFKPDWNPDLFFSQNYVSHLGVYKKSLLDRANGFRVGVEGSQDYDLLLRCLPHIKATQVKHVPYVLYHWRILPGSTAMGSGEKDYTTQAGIQSLENYFTQAGTPVLVEKGKVPNTYRVHYPIPSPEPLVSLLIPTRDKVEVIEVAVRSILEKTTYQNYEILILDNGSVESETLTYFEKIQTQDKRIRVLRWDFPFNYSAINNFGAKHAKGEILGLINNDVEVISPEWLTEMVSHALRPEIGCVGAKLYYANDTLQHAGVALGIGGVAGHVCLKAPRSSQGAFAKLVTIQNTSAVTAAALLVRANVFNQVNGLNEENLTVAFNDVDFCLKVGQCGFRNLWTPYAELYHYESISRGAEDNPEKLARFASEVHYMKKTWGDLLARDPMYNPNLSLNKQDHSITSTVHPCFKFATKA